MWEIPARSTRSGQSATLKAAIGTRLPDSARRSGSKCPVRACCWRRGTVRPG